MRALGPDIGRDTTPRVERNCQIGSGRSVPRQARDALSTSKGVVAAAGSAVEGWL